MKSTPQGEVSRLANGSGAPRSAWDERRQVWQARIDRAVDAFALSRNLREHGLWRRRRHEWEKGA